MDYVKDQMENMDLSRKEALEYCTPGNVVDWFHQIYNWDDVEAQGKLIGQPTPEQIIGALDQVRRSQRAPEVSTEEPDATQVARIKRVALKKIANTTPDETTTLPKPPKF